MIAVNVCKKIIGLDQIWNVFLLFNIFDTSKFFENIFTRIRGKIIGESISSVFNQEMKGSHFKRLLTENYYSFQ